MTAEVTMDARRSAEASEWLVRLREEPNEEATVSGWLRWCEADPANAAAFERVQRMCRQLDQVLTDQITFLADSEPSQTETVATVAERPSSARSKWAKVTTLALAASIAAAAIFFWMPRSETPSAIAPVATRENRTTTLPDGSLVELGAKTTVAVEFSGKQRLLKLSEGQAYFDVQPDKDRPFTVQAGELEVTAVGTAFDVKHQPGSIMVTVQEGIVAVSSPKHVLRGTEASAWRVASGNQFVYSEASGTATLSSVDTSAVLAWREGRMEYTRTALEVVVADINRYSMHPVEIADPALGTLTFTGTVFTDSVDSWLTALPGALPVQVQRTGEGKVVLRSPPRGSTMRTP